MPNEHLYSPRMVAREKCKINKQRTHTRSKHYEQLEIIMHHLYQIMQYR